MHVALPYDLRHVPGGSTARDDGGFQPGSEPMRFFGTRAAIQAALVTGILSFTQSPAWAAVDSGGPSITTAGQSMAEEQTRTQLDRLIRSFDLAPFRFTCEVIVDQRSIPHSHPVLTLHTRHLKDDDLLLSTYLHEQFHWFLAQHPAETEKAVASLSRMYPSLPVRFPQGSDDAMGNHIHILTIYFEYRALRRVLGELRAKEVFDFWADDHYTAIYRTVLSDQRQIADVVSASGLGAFFPSAGTASPPCKGDARG